MTAKTTITENTTGHIPVITYKFKKGDRTIKVDADNYRQARNRLNNLVCGEKGFKLVERIA